MATRQGRKIDPCKDMEGSFAIAPFLNILCNNVQIYGTDTENAPPLFIIKTLVERGGVAYLRSAREWFAYTTAKRRRRTGFPSAVRLIGDNGRVSEPFDVHERDGDIVIFPANAYFFPPVYEVQRQVDALAAVSSALGQNLDALRQSTAIIYDDPDLTQEIEAAERARLSGAQTVKIKKNSGRTVDIQTFSPQARSNIPDFLALWTETLEELDALTGRATVGEKNERRISEEISVIEDSACSSIDVIIDTFNRFAEWYGVDAHAVRGSEIRREAKTSEDEETPAEDENEPQKGSKGATE